MSISDKKNMYTVKRDADGNAYFVPTTSDPGVLANGPTPEELLAADEKLNPPKKGKKRKNKDKTPTDTDAPVDTLGADVEDVPNEHNTDPDADPEVAQDPDHRDDPDHPQTAGLGVDDIQTNPAIAEEEPAKPERSSWFGKKK